MARPRFFSRCGAGMLCLAVVGASGLPAQGPWLDSQSANLADQRAAAERFLDGLAGEGPAGARVPLRERMARLSALKPPLLTREDFKRAGARPYASNQILGSMGLLAALAAASVGSSQQAAQAALLQQYAGLLAGNENSGLLQAGAILGQESQDVAAGDASGAASLAQAFAGIAPAEVPPSYVPSPQDDALSDSLQLVDTYDWAATFMALGQAVMAGLMGAIEGGVYGAVVGVAVSLVASAIQGDFTQQNSTLAGGNGASSNGASAGSAEAQTLAGIVGASSGAGSLKSTAAGSSGGLGAPLAVPSGAAGQQVMPGKGSAAGGALVGAVQIP